MRRTPSRKVLGGIALVVGALICGYLWVPRSKPVSNVKTEDSGCISNLHRISQAIALYRAEWGSEGVYGNINQMGLPDGLGPNRGHGLFLSQGSLNRCPYLPSEVIGDARGWPYIYVVGVTFARGGDGNRRRWEAYSSRYQENSLVLIDLNHNPDASICSPMSKIKGIGLTLGGSVVSRRIRGDADLFELSRWHE